MKHANIEIYREGRWQTAAKLCPIHPELGYRSASYFEYQHEYILEYGNQNQTAAAGLSCRYPVDFTLHKEPHWPAFILDILPSGYGRERWLEHLEIKDGPSADWPLLLHGVAFVPGNLRITQALAQRKPSTLVPRANGELIAMHSHPGFSREQVVTRNEYFVEYAFQHGIYAAGGSDVQGMAPKLLLTQDQQGAWHAEGAIADGDVSAHWIVKRPRGNKNADRKVLKNEAAYMQVAQELGLKVHAKLLYENDTLFVPRFDRIVNSDLSVQRLGMESLCSLAGISDFGVPISQDVLCEALIAFSTDPSADLLEYIKRDIVNVMMGNKDNHARNTSVLRFDSGEVTLSPLYDFAPMYLDPEGIARVCRWNDAAEQAGSPVWAQVLEKFGKHMHHPKQELLAFAERLINLEKIMYVAGVDADIINNQKHAIDSNLKQLQAL